MTPENPHKPIIDAAALVASCTCRTKSHEPKAHREDCRYRMATEIIENADELQRVFDMRWAADMRAIKRWQAAGPGRELTWPDRADMVVFLLEIIERHDQRVTELLEANNREVEARRAAQRISRATPMGRPFPLTTPPHTSGRFYVFHRGYGKLIHYLDPNGGPWHLTAILGWQHPDGKRQAYDPAKEFRATHWCSLPEID